MNLKDIQELIKFVAKSGATDVNLEIDNIKISIKSPPKKRRGEDEELKTVIHEAPAQLIATQPPVVQATPVEKEPTEKESNYITVKASMIGTFYRSSSPESSPFVNVGDTIKKGDTICIIEAMKLFNEIESEVSGKIIKVLVDDTTPIEFDQPLFLVDPS
ncbi:MAG: acetyl-CoA carboxylase, biotin carboxyl carrier protein [Flavobacteriales bacterium]|nr:acetyl-CoA carboxylase, biotin carboxyl carrier protein [Flavobacteriales bacterium]|tara:strand:- start:16 stop:495 length:480 start_codon:yes stop_codon:yes gene_type:complete